MITPVISSPGACDEFCFAPGSSSLSRVAPAPDNAPTDVAMEGRGPELVKVGDGIWDHLSRLRMLGFKTEAQNWGITQNKISETQETNHFLLVKSVQQPTGFRV